MEDRIVVRIKADAGIELPHKVTKNNIEYEFKPDAELPKAFGESLIKTRPDIYVEGKGKPDLGKYKFKKTFQVKEVQNVLDDLTEEELVEVYDYAKKLRAERDKKDKTEKKDDPEKKDKKDE